MNKQECGHNTKAACSICANCFACCGCDKAAQAVFKLASRIQKRDKWFIGGYLGQVMDEWEESRGR